MTDRETWDQAVAVVAKGFEGLSPSRRAAAAKAVAATKACKNELHTIVAGVSAAEICASCGGECCRTGKYHFTVVDLLAYLADGKQLFTPRFGRQVCPYLGEEGCQMEPAYRPYNCVTFNCEQVEALLEPEALERLVCLERQLRGHYGTVEDLFGARLMGGLLMNCERHHDLFRINGR